MSRSQEGLGHFTRDTGRPEEPVPGGHHIERRRSYLSGGSHPQDCPGRTKRWQCDTKRGAGNAGTPKPRNPKPDAGFSFTDRGLHVKEVVPTEGIKGCVPLLHMLGFKR